MLENLDFSSELFQELEQITSPRPSSDYCDLYRKEKARNVKFKSLLISFQKSTKELLMELRDSKKKAEDLESKLIQCERDLNQKNCEFNELEFRSLNKIHLQEQTIEEYKGLSNKTHEDHIELAKEYLSLLSDITRYHNYVIDKRRTKMRIKTEAFMRIEDPSFKAIIIKSYGKKKVTNSYDYDTDSVSNGSIESTISKKRCSINILKRACKIPRIDSPDLDYFSEMSVTSSFNSSTIDDDFESVNSVGSYVDYSRSLYTEEHGQSKIDNESFGEEVTLVPVEHSYTKVPERKVVLTTSIGVNTDPDPVKIPELPQLTDEIDERVCKSTTDKSIQTRIVTTSSKSILTDPVTVSDVVPLKEFTDQSIATDGLVEVACNCNQTKVEAKDQSTNTSFSMVTRGTLTESSPKRSTAVGCSASDFVERETSLEQIFNEMILNLPPLMERIEELKLKMSQSCQTSSVQLCSTKTITEIQNIRNEVGYINRDDGEKSHWVKPEKISPASSCTNLSKLTDKEHDFAVIGRVMLNIFMELVNQQHFSFSKKTSTEITERILDGFKIYNNWLENPAIELPFSSESIFNLSSESECARYEIASERAEKVVEGMNVSEKSVASETIHSIESTGRRFSTDFEYEETFAFKNPEKVVEEMNSEKSVTSEILQSDLETTQSIERRLSTDSECFLALRDIRTLQIVSPIKTIENRVENSANLETDKVVQEETNHSDKIVDLFLKPVLATPTKECPEMKEVEKRSELFLKPEIPSIFASKQRRSRTYSTDTECNLVQKNMMELRESLQLVSPIKNTSIEHKIKKRKMKTDRQKVRSFFNVPQRLSPIPPFGEDFEIVNAAEDTEKAKESTISLEYENPQSPMNFLDGFDFCHETPEIPLERTENKHWPPDEEEPDFGGFGDSDLSDILCRDSPRSPVPFERFESDCDLLRVPKLIPLRWKPDELKKTKTNIEKVLEFKPRIQQLLFTNTELELLEEKRMCNIRKHLKLFLTTEWSEESLNVCLEKLEKYLNRPKLLVLAFWETIEDEYSEVSYEFTPPAPALPRHQQKLLIVFEKLAKKNPHLPNMFVEHMEASLFKISNSKKDFHEYLENVTYFYTAIVDIFFDGSLEKVFFFMFKSMYFMSNQSASIVNILLKAYPKLLPTKKELLMVYRDDLDFDSIDFKVIPTIDLDLMKVDPLVLTIIFMLTSENPGKQKGALDIRRHQLLNYVTKRYVYWPNFLKLDRLIDTLVQHINNNNFHNVAFSFILLTRYTLTQGILKNILMCKLVPLLRKTFDEALMSQPEEEDCSNEKMIVLLDTISCIMKKFTNEHKQAFKPTFQLFVEILGKSSNQRVQEACVKAMLRVNRVFDNLRDIYQIIRNWNPQFQLSPSLIIMLHTFVHRMSKTFFSSKAK